ncbi:hypothetical protein [Bifidobacterium sp. SO1]|uniref:hypothetical protein n=1 Tax=Bifidobacterium sp. SO1 TaxID=2809029 RepID=UPI001BDBB457|nr:hypothetical protein [Bifidobacterium sp. SO1]MBT1162188.1 hypothetical protein [Bifidobacterium sp. SO1]
MEEPIPVDTEPIETNPTEAEPTSKQDTLNEPGIYAFTFSVLCSILATGSLLTIGGALLVRILFHIRIFHNVLTAVEATALPLFLLAGILWLIGMFVKWNANRKTRKLERQKNRRRETGRHGAK